MFLEECKYTVKKKKIPEYVSDDIEISSDDSDKEDFDKEDSATEYSDEDSNFEGEI